MKALLITGPTGIGKSKLVKYLENHLDCIIVNADAFQIYSSLPIITARPYVKDNYFLYGHIEDCKHYSVGHWLNEVSDVLSDFHTLFPEKFVVFVGGTGLYFSKLINGISNIPKITKDVKKLSLELFNSYGINYFLHRLEKDDPIAFETIDKRNPRRVVRAWEVLEASGKTITYWHQHNLPPLIAAKDFKGFVLEMTKETLDQRNAQRFSKMLALGAIDECSLARSNGLTQNCQSFKAIGVSEIFDYLDGRISLKEVEYRAIVRTRQYSKRQMTWYRNNFYDWTWYNLNKLDYSQIVKKIITSI